MNIRVSDKEVANEIYRLFANDGNLDPRFYDYWVRNTFRGRPREFEETVREHLSAQKVRENALEGIPQDQVQGRWIEYFLEVMKRANFKDYTPN